MMSEITLTIDGAGVTVPQVAPGRRDAQERRAREAASAHH